jgi:membrane associated rhomboid family serine protease
MTEIPLVADGLSEQIDVCTGCHLIWFDRGEFEALPRTASRKPTRRKLTDEQIDALALARLEQVKSRQYAEETGVDHWWEVPLAFCGIPIEYNRTPLRSRPLVTWLLAAVIAAVSIAAFRDLASAVKGWGLIPAEFGRHFGLTFVTSFLLHGGILHLLGNLYYLVVFGDNTEDILGRGRYLLLIALAVMVGDIAHILSNPGSTTPCVGASGGISGVLAYYCLRFPHARVGIIFWFRWFVPHARYRDVRPLDSAASDNTGTTVRGFRTSRRLRPPRRSGGRNCLLAGDATDSGPRRCRCIEARG